MDELELSIIVPYYNKWSRTKYLIESINRQSVDKSLFEVIFVDDGSEISLESYLRELKLLFQYKVIRTQNQGRAAARNVGLHAAVGKVIMFTDDDIILSPGLIEEHLRIHRNKTGIFVHSVIYDLIKLMKYEDVENGHFFDWIDQERCKCNEDDLLSFEKVFVNWEGFTANKRLSRLEKRILNIIDNEDLKEIQWEAFVGGNVSLDRKLCLSVGGFDERFRVWGGEDFELGYRLQQKGVTAVATTDGFCYHITHSHSNSNLERNISRDYFYQKYKDNNIRLLYEFLERK